MNKSQYSAYRRSNEWAQKRNVKYYAQGVRDELGRYKCDHCGDYFHRCRTEVHHKTYERVGNEDLDDLEILCEDCHGKHHGISEVKCFEVPK